ncbi:DUF6470 family protein [Paenibacillus sp. sgz5001063]|uniref:DUF6470 family protein n=1 Tax=Paenibacillus sp. sgz5001063 TaxID=3242474 RepID=UPI0036D380AB
MQIPRIQIQQGYSKLAVETTQGQWDIKQPKPTLNLDQESGELQIEQNEGKLEIDSQKAWSALGLARFLEFADRVAQSSLESSMQNIAEIAQAGDRMMAFQKKGNAFAEIARQNAFKERPIEFCGPPSYDNVDVTFSPGTISMNHISSKVSADPEIHAPQIDYMPGKIKIYVAQKNFISMTVTGENLNKVV